jgi:ribulose-5-phosphate 4-epimerase/fuculose-1-phosphate aldolase
VQRAQIQTQLLEACRRLAGKGLLHTAADSFSMRIPASLEMIVASGNADWSRITATDLREVSLLSKERVDGIHTSIYRMRGDVGAVAITSPRGVRLLAGCGGMLPPVFDEQVRHIGLPVGPLDYVQSADAEALRKTFARGANASLLGGQLLCLGMTCERVLLNTELYEKCARAYVIAKASGRRIGAIPLWVRLIANQRLMKDERRAEASYRSGRIPEGINSY